jgi:hypothetical protein
MDEHPVGVDGRVVREDGTTAYGARVWAAGLGRRAATLV